MSVRLVYSFILASILLGGHALTPVSLIYPVAAAMQDDQKTADDDEQDEENNESKAATVTVRGQLVLADPATEFEIKGMQVVLDEFMTPPALPLPDKFTEMAIEERQKWYANFIESDAGKEYQKKVDEMQEIRQYEETEADADGRFVFKKVKRSRFGLYGQKQFSKDGKTFVAEFQAEFPIEDKVKFIELDRLPVVVKRVLQVGEVAPELKLKAEGPDSVHSLKQYAGKHVLLYFWTISSAQHIHTELQKTVDANLGVEILGINLNQPGDELTEYMKENSSAWKVITSDGLNGAPVTIDYSVNQLPSMWLVGPDGKIKVTDIQFFQALGKPDASLAQTLKKALSGEPVVESPEQ